MKRLPLALSLCSVFFFALGLILNPSRSWAADVPDWVQWVSTLEGLNFLALSQASHFVMKGAS